MYPCKCPFWKFNTLVKAGRWGVEVFIRQHLMIQMQSSDANKEEEEDEEEEDANTYWLVSVPSTLLFALSHIIL